MNIKTFWLCLCFFAGYAAFPARSVENTSRIQQFEFSGQVITLTLAEGVLTTLEFPEGDLIRTASFGDEQAWTYKKDGNLLVLKPRAPDAGTNLTVFTTNRAFLFRINSLRADEFYIPYWVRITLPVIEPIPLKPNQPVPLTPVEKARKVARLVEQEFKTAPYRGRINFDYWAQGSRELQPIAAHDNGMHTYLTFSAGSPMPAAFVYDADGGETTTDFHYEGQTLVLHLVTDRILLRHGQTVTGVTNASYSPNAKPPASGTIAPGIERTIKRPNTP